MSDALALAMTEITEKMQARFDAQLVEHERKQRAEIKAQAEKHEADMQRSREDMQHEMQLVRNTANNANSNVTRLIEVQDKTERTLAEFHAEFMGYAAQNNAIASSEKKRKCVESYVHDTKKAKLVEDAIHLKIPSVRKTDTKRTMVGKFVKYYTCLREAGALPDEDCI